MRKIALLTVLILVAGCGGGGAGGGAPMLPSSRTLPQPATPAPAATPTLSPASAAYLNLSLASLYAYANPTLPAFYNGVPTNTPATNPVTDKGALLGRVIFNDRRMSTTSTVSCASCHQQPVGFSDSLQFSSGVNGGVTTRHAMRLANVAYYLPGTMFWDKRAASVEAQAIVPMQTTTEMGWDSAHGGLSALESKMASLPYYPELFRFVFGDPAITTARIEQSVAQYERSMVSTNSRWDVGFGLVAALGRPPNFDTAIPTFSAQENRGLHLFMAGPQQGGVGCASCHQPPSFALDGRSLSNGLDAGQTTIFKSPSLKNVGIAGHFMHDGRFTTLDQVVEHYNSGILTGPSLDPRLQRNGIPIRLNLSTTDKAAIVAFLQTLTDTAITTDPRYSSPFKQ